MKILVPTAGKMPATETAEYIVDIIRRLGGELVALHIAREGEDPVEVEDSLGVFAMAAQYANVPFELETAEGEVAATIAEVATRLEIALIVMGASPEEAVNEWMSARVMGAGEVPVVVVPREIEVS